MSGPHGSLAFRFRRSDMGAASRWGVTPMALGSATGPAWSTSGCRADPARRQERAAPAVRQLGL